MMAGVGVAKAQTKAVPGAALKKALKEQYQVSKKSTRSMDEVKTVLVVQKEGIMAFPAEKIVLPDMTYKDGMLKAPSSVSKSSGNAARTLAIGKKVYLTKLDVNVIANKVSFTVQECAACMGTPDVPASAAALVFAFPKDYLTTAEVSQVTEVIGEVLALDKPQMAGDEVLTNQSVMKMVSAKLPEEVIITKIRTSQTNFDVTTTGLVQLNNQNVSAPILRAMMTGPASAAIDTQAPIAEEPVQEQTAGSTDSGAPADASQENAGAMAFSVFHDHGNLDPDQPRYCQGVLYIFGDRVKYQTSGSVDGRRDDFEVSYDGVSEVKKNFWPIMRQEAFHVKLKGSLSLNFVPEGNNVAQVLAAFPSPPRK
jgi:hypothetical protein